MSQGCREGPVPARIVNISSPVTVNEGGNVNLLCLAVGRPEPTVTWRQLRGIPHPDIRSPDQDGVTSSNSQETLCKHPP
ncbi:IgLON family member 5 [Myotis davidii]|uniref:IgLON family member 5 n=1 Tax=Myotis davidii TaxID=225400 RepID=L5MHA2_MYODS|nr:IgLON family member 5 [Myotis davidii]